METIKERANNKYKPIAKDYIVAVSRNSFAEDLKDAYVKGAKDQKAIYIERLKGIMNSLMLDTRVKAEIIKAMEG